MKIEKIKPIPKYIVARIKRADKQNNITVPGHTRFYSYLTKNDGELVKVTVAVKEKRKKVCPGRTLVLQTSCRSRSSLGQMLRERYELHLHSRIYCWLACGRLNELPLLV